MAKGEIAHHEQLLLPQKFQNSFAVDMSHCLTHTTNLQQTTLKTSYQKCEKSPLRTV